MSTRFVWEKTSFRLVRGDDFYWVDFPEYLEDKAYVSESYIINSDGTFSLDPSKSYVMLGSDDAEETSRYPYMFPSKISDIHFKSPVLHKSKPASDYPDDIIFWYKLSERTKDTYRVYTCRSRNGTNIIGHETYSCQKGTQAVRLSGPSQGPYRGSLGPCNTPANISRRCVA